MDLTMLFEGYREFNQSHPHLSTMLTAEATYLLGDVASQLITDRKINPRRLAFTAQMAPFYGLCLEGLMETGNVVKEYVSENPLVMSALGPNFVGNFYNIFFFANNTIAEKKKYSLSDVLSYYKGLFTDKASIGHRFKEKIIDNVPKKEYVNSVIATLTAWNLFQWYNYSEVPKDMQMPLVLGASIIWTAIMSLWALNGGRRVADKEPVSAETL